MLRGWFEDVTGRPYIEGRLFLRRLNIWGNVYFLVNTGSDATSLNPLDGARMNIDYSTLQGTAESTGIGGVVRDFVEPAVVVFTEFRRYSYLYSIHLRVSPPEPEIMRLPSLLGRDVLDRWYMMYNPSLKTLRFKVMSSDLTTPIPR